MESRIPMAGNGFGETVRLAINISDSGHRTRMTNIKPHILARATGLGKTTFRKGLARMRGSQGDTQGHRVAGLLLFRVFVPTRFFSVSRFTCAANPVLSPRHRTRILLVERRTTSSREQISGREELSGSIKLLGIRTPPPFHTPC